MTWTSPCAQAGCAGPIGRQQAVRKQSTSFLPTTRGDARRAPCLAEPASQLATVNDFCRSLTLIHEPFNVKALDQTALSLAVGNPTVTTSVLEGRIALVTGGDRGIGHAISIALAREGARVAVNYRRDAEAAAQTVAEIEKNDGTARAFQGSVGRLDDDVALVAAVTDELGPIDILVNNGGVASRGRFVADTDPEELERVMRTHALGVHHLCHLVLPAMRRRSRSDIIMISSVATDYMSAGGAPYNMGKAAMEALALTLAKEEAANGVRVNIVAPGLVATDMGDRLARARMNVNDVSELDSATPFGRVCQPEDIAETVCFLVSDRASLITGQRIGIDGGGLGDGHA